MVSKNDDMESNHEGQVEEKSAEMSASRREALAKLGLFTLTLGATIAGTHEVRADEEGSYDDSSGKSGSSGSKGSYDDDEKGSYESSGKKSSKGSYESSGKKGSYDDDKKGSYESSGKKGSYPGADSVESASGESSVPSDERGSFGYSAPKTEVLSKGGEY